MTTSMLERPVVSGAAVNSAVLQCIVCHRAFDFGVGETAVVLRHIAYGYDFTHTGGCLAAALEWIFVEPGYDRPAFSLDGERARILATAAADGWSAVVPQPPERVLAGDLVEFEPLRCWALVEHRDGSSRLEGIVRDLDWDEPGGAEFPEAERGARACIDYTSTDEQRSITRRADWAALIQARYRGKAVKAARRSCKSNCVGLRQRRRRRCTGARHRSPVSRLPHRRNWHARRARVEMEINLADQPPAEAAQPDIAGH